MTEELPSKSQRKREMHALQDLGTALVELNDEQLAAVDLPENLRDAVQEARRLEGKHEARRRQMQYIGKLMRHIDPEPIRASIDAYKAVSREQTARLHMLERWRTRLLEDDTALAALMGAYPHADAARIRVLLRNAERERGAGQPPKSFRALFQLLNETIMSNDEHE
jgi:ribosome-associated protein